jgi:hypothetical protein
MVRRAKLHAAIAESSARLEQFAEICQASFRSRHDEIYLSLHR